MVIDFMEDNMELSRNGSGTAATAKNRNFSLK